MSSSKIYLCPSCQSAIRSEKEAAEGLVCGECGFSFGEKKAAKPALSPALQDERRSFGRVSSVGVVRDVMQQRVEAAAPAEFNSSAAVQALVVQAEAEGKDLEKGSRDEESILPDGTRQVKRRKKRRKEEHKKLYIFITACVGVVIALVLLFQIKGEEKEKPTGGPELAGVVPWKREFYREHLPAIGRNLNGYNMIPSLSKKLQFVDRSSELSADFIRFNQTHTTRDYEGRMRLVGQNILELQKDPIFLAVETIWLDEESAQAEAVHVWNGKEWKLDWELYAPYSNVPWTLFRSGVGKEAGEFRLLVRQRRGRVESDEMTLLFYFPQLAGEESLEVIRNTESPEVVIERGGELGKKLSGLFRERASGGRPLGSILGGDDPEGMIRVWVSLAWEEAEEGERKMVLKGLNGVSWYGSRIQEVLSRQENAEELKSDLNDSDPDSSLPADE